MITKQLEKILASSFKHHQKANSEGIQETPQERIAMALAANWHKLMPHSRAVAKRSTLRFANGVNQTWNVYMFVAKDKTEVTNGITENDPIRFLIQLHPGVEGTVSANIECYITTKATNPYNAQGHEKLRSASVKNADEAKVLKTCLVYQKKVKDTLVSLVNDDRMLPTDRHGIQSPWDWRQKLHASRSVQTTGFDFTDVFKDEGGFTNVRTHERIDSEIEMLDYLEKYMTKSWSCDIKGDGVAYEYDASARKWYGVVGGSRSPNLSIVVDHIFRYNRYGSMIKFKWTAK